MPAIDWNPTYQVPPPPKPNLLSDWVYRGRTTYIFGASKQTDMVLMWIAHHLGREGAVTAWLYSGAQDLPHLLAHKEALRASSISLREQGAVAGEAMRRASDLHDAALEAGKGFQLKHGVVDLLVITRPRISQQLSITAQRRNIARLTELMDIAQYFSRMSFAVVVTLEPPPGPRGKQYSTVKQIAKGMGSNTVLFLNDQRNDGGHQGWSLTNLSPTAQSPVGWNLNVALHPEGYADVSFKESIATVYDVAEIPTRVTRQERFENWMKSFFDQVPAGHYVSVRDAKHHGILSGELTAKSWEALSPVFMEKTQADDGQWMCRPRSSAIAIPRYPNAN